MLGSASVLTYSTRAIISSNERIKLLDTIIPKVEEAGIRKILVDTVDGYSYTRIRCKAIYKVKNQRG